MLFLAFGAPRAGAQTAAPATPTIDRLAKPTLPAIPSQADLGAQDYWLYCSPCHGDKAQGLTDEFRQQYPPEDQYCWKSGCHGRRPYPNGWTIPTPVPALVGPGALTNFSDAAQVFAFMRAAMPFQKPGSLDDDTYWRITAFVMRQNGYRQDSAPLNAANAAAVKIPRSPTPPPVATPAPAASAPQAQSPSFADWLAGGAFLSLLVLMIFLIRRSRTNS
ncbi:MAG: hypothetical protein OHK0031_18370 [Anaerolineales bacterium]